MLITLNAHEVELAANVGVRRQLEALRRGLQDKHGYEGDGWSIHLHGAAGEMAVAKALNTYWNGSFNTFKAPDVGQLQVRTRSGDGPRRDLIVRGADRDEDIFVLVVGRIPSFDVVGWCRGGDAKRVEYLREYGGRPAAYFVPSDALVSIDSLSDWARRMAA